MNWTTRDGRVIPIESMSTSHIVNTIAYLERHADQHQAIPAGSIVQALAFVHGEQATYALEQMLDHAMDNALPSLESRPVYKALQRELRKRLRLPT